MFYHSMIQPYFDYCNIVWAAGGSGSYLDHLLKKQKQTIRVITFAKWNAHFDHIFKQLKILKLKQINIFQTCCFVYKSLHNLLHVNLELCSPSIMKSITIILEHLTKYIRFNIVLMWRLEVLKSMLLKCATHLAMLLPNLHCSVFSKSYAKSIFVNISLNHISPPSLTLSHYFLSFPFSFTSSRDNYTSLH